MKHFAPPVDAPVWQDPRAVALLMAATLTTMANATISPALPGLEHLFADRPGAALLTRLLVPAPSLAIVFCAPLAGMVADRFGRRRLLLVGVILFAITGSAGLILPDLPSILTSRLALGIAVAMIMTAQTALIGDYFTGGRRAAMMGLQVSARNFGGFLFISLAGWLAMTSPRLPFAIYGLAILYLPFIWSTIRESGVVPPQIAPLTTDEARSLPTWVGPILALALLQMTTNMAFFVVPTQLPFFLDDFGYDSAAMTGSTLGALTLTGGGAALLYGRVKGAIGHAGAYALGYALMAIGFASLSFGAALWALFAGAVAIGAGFATVMPNFVAIALTLAPAARRGMAGGILTTSVFLGQVASPFLSTASISVFGYGATLRGTALVLVAIALSSLAARGMERMRLRRKAT